MSNGHYGDITIDVSSSPYETGFKFNTLPFGGMTIDAGNAVRLSSATDLKLVPSGGSSVISEGVLVIATSAASPPTASAALRGALFLLREASGTQDKLKVCVKTTADSYAWKDVTIP